MKAKLMLLALSFAFLGFVNSHAASTAATYGQGFLQDLTSGAALPWIAWHPGPMAQAMLFVLQGALGCVLILCFMRYQRQERKELGWD